MYKDEPIAKNAESVGDSVSSVMNGLDNMVLREVFHDSDELMSGFMEWLDYEANELDPLDFNIMYPDARLGDALRLFFINQVKPKLAEEVFSHYFYGRLERE